MMSGRSLRSDWVEGCAVTRVRTPLTPRSIRLNSSGLGLLKPGVVNRNSQYRMGAER